MDLRVSSHHIVFNNGHPSQMIADATMIIAAWPKKLNITNYQLFPLLSFFAWPIIPHT